MQKDISLSDLRLTLRSGKSVNLLDKHHYSYTLEQLQESAKSGSIFKKSYAVKVREVAPYPKAHRIDILDKRSILKPIRNKVQIEQKYYEELDFEDERAAEEQFALDEAEADFQDNAPVLAVDKKYTDPESDE